LIVPNGVYVYWCVALSSYGSELLPFLLVISNKSGISCMD